MSPGTSPQVGTAPRRGVMQKALAMWILLAAGGGGQPEVSPTQVAVSYTHLTLPTIYSV